MEDALRHCLKVLQVLADRTNQARAAIVDGDEDHALEVLASRNAAFANLKVAMWKLEQIGIDPMSHREVRDLMAAVEAETKLLGSLVKTMTSKLEKELRRIGTVKKKLKGYHSGVGQGSQFEKTV